MRIGKHSLENKMNCEGCEANFILFSAALPADTDQHLGGEQLDHRVPRPRGHHLHLHGAALQSGH